MSSRRLKEKARAYRAEHPELTYQQARNAVMSDADTLSELAEVLGFTDIGTYDSAQKWADTEFSPYLRVPLGWGTVNNEPTTKRITVDLSEGAPGGTGPHGLLCGKTGTGKSRLTRSIAVSLCAEYSPSRLNILYLDFKYGDVLGSMDTLPHIVGVATSLESDEAKMRRVEAFLNTEMDRRAQFLYAQQSKSAREHLEKRKSNPSLKPLPELVIIAEEFNEYMRRNSDRMKLFQRIAAQGRSLGVHLLLSDQFFDTDIVGEIINNFSYGISLTTATEEQSRVVLGGDSSAARLPLGAGDAILRCVDPTTQENSLIPFRVYKGGFDAFITDTLYSVKVKAPDVPRLSEDFPAALDAGEHFTVSENGWDIGVLDTFTSPVSPLNITKDRDVQLHGNTNLARAAALRTLLTQAAWKFSRGQDDTEWFVIDADGTLGFCAKFPNVAAYLDTRIAPTVDMTRREVKKEYELVALAHDHLLSDIHRHAQKHPERAFFIVVNGEIHNNHVTVDDGDLPENVNIVVSSRDASESHLRPLRNGHMVIDLGDGGDRCHVDGVSAVIAYTDPGAVPLFGTEQVKQVFPVDTTSRVGKLSHPVDGYPLGRNPFTGEQVNLPASAQVVNVVGGKGRGKSTTLRTIIESIAAVRGCDNAEFIVIDPRMSLTDTVRSLIGSGHMVDADYSVNEKEKEAALCETFSILKSRVPSRETALRARNANGTWWDGKHLYLVWDGATDRELNNFRRVYSAYSNYDIGMTVIFSSFESNSIRDFSDTVIDLDTRPAVGGSILERLNRTGVGTGTLGTVHVALPENG